MDNSLIYQLIRNLPECLDSKHFPLGCGERMCDLRLEVGAKYRCLYLGWGENFTVGANYTAEQFNGVAFITDDNGRIQVNARSRFLKYNSQRDNFENN